MRHSPVILSLVFLTLLSCTSKPRKATPEDTASVDRTCSKHADYDPAGGAKVIATVDQKLAGAMPDWRAGLMNVCYFSKENIFIAYTTIEDADTASREQLCEAFRDSGATGTITPIYVHCKDGKRCTTCRQGSGGHR